MTLKDIRKLKKLTLEDVSKKLECSKQAYWNYENGIRRMPLDIAVKLAKIYDKTVEEIFFYTSSNRNVN